MKSQLNSSGMTVADALTPGSRRLLALLSPQNGGRQVAGRPDPNRSLRLPVSAGNRERLKELRAAESAAWDAAGRMEETRARNRIATGRLPAPARNTGEGWLYAVLASLCAGILGHEVWTVFQSAGNWHQFVQYVRQLLA